jgi:hypothetical protein
MALQYCIATGAVTLAANTPKTMIEIPTGASAPFVIYLMEIATGTITAVASLTVQWGTYTTTGTGTTVTPLKIGVDQSVAAILGTVKIAETSNGAGFTAGAFPQLLLPLPGMYSISYPFGREPYQPISTLRALQLTNTSTLYSTTCTVNLYIEQ